MDSNSSFKKNTILLTIGTMLNKGLQFLAIPFFSRWLTAEEYGQFDLYYTYVLLFLPILSLGIQESIFRFSVDEKNIKIINQNISIGMIVNIFNFTLITIIVLANSVFSCVMASCFLLYLAAELTNQYLRGVLRAIKRLDIYSYAMVISTLSMTFFVVIGVKGTNLGLLGMMLGYGLGAWVGNFIIIIWSNWIKMIVLNISFRRMKEMLRYSLPLVPNDVSWWIMNASDRQIINVYFGDSANGIYAIAHKIPALCSIVFNMFSLSWQQEVIENIDSIKREEYFNEVYNKLLVVLFTFCSGLLTGGFAFYNFIFDRKYYEAAYYSPILICAALVMALSQFLGGIQIALKQSGKNGITTVIGAIFNIGIHLSLVRFIGLYAAAISTLLGNIIVFALRKIWLKNIFIIRLEKKSILSAIVFLYFLGSSYVMSSLVINVINLLLSAIIFISFNSEFISGIAKKKRGLVK